MRVCKQGQEISSQNAAKRGALVSAYVSPGMEVLFFWFLALFVPPTVTAHFFFFFHTLVIIFSLFLLLKSRYMNFFPTQTVASPSSYFTTFMNFKIQDTFTVIYPPPLPRKTFPPRFPLSPFLCHESWWENSLFNIAKMTQVRLCCDDDDVRLSSQAESADRVHPTPLLHAWRRHE